MRLVDDVQTLLNASPDVAPILGLGPFKTFPELIGGLFAGLCNNAAIGSVFTKTYAVDPQLVALSVHDISETARRNFEPGAEATTLLFSRGVQAVMAHRVAHKIWNDGDTNLALAVKATCGQSFGTDIHPAANIGAGLWLDHGLGCVIGETSVIGEDVSIWHNVTLGSTLNDSGEFRHPHVGRGVVIGAGAILLGGIHIGAHANIAAGAIVLQDVAEGVLVAGQKAAPRGPAKVSFAGKGMSQ